MIMNKLPEIGSVLRFKEGKNKFQLNVIGMIEEPFIYLKMIDKKTKQIYYYEWGLGFIKEENYDVSKEKQLTEKEQLLLKFIMM